MLKHKGLTLVYLLYLLFLVNTAVAETPWSLTQTSAGKQFDATLTCDVAPLVGKFQTCSLHLFKKVGDNKEAPATQSIKNATIVIGGGMPAHQHGLPTNPLIKWSSKDNAYKIQGLKFSMPGTWVLHFYINALDNLKTEKDTVSFKFTI